MKTYIGVDADSGLVHTVTTSSTNESDVAQVADLLHGKEERRTAGIRSKVEHPFRVIKRQASLTKVRIRGLENNMGHALTLFGLSNLWMTRRSLMAMVGVVRPNAA